MTSVEELPLGAESPDELLVAYANGSLTGAERAEVDRWLAVHPEWNSRLNAYRAIGGAVRHAAAGSDGPAIGSLSGLWAAIDAQPQSRPLRPPAPPAPPVSHGGGHDRRSTTWLLAVAAALIVAVAAASVVVATTRNNDDSTIAARPERSPTTEAVESGAGALPDAAAEPAPAGEGDADAAAALRAAAKDTADEDTAHTTVHLTGVSDVSGTQLADIFEAENVTATIEGTGQVEFPDRAIFDTNYTLEEAPDLPPQHSVTVQDGDQTEVSCNGGAFVPPVEAEGCTEFGFGSSFTGPLAAVELLASAQSGVRIVGSETLDGAETQRFRLVATLPDETGELRDITTDVWIGVDDGLIHQVVQTGDIVIIVPVTGALPEELLVPTAITLTYTLGQFGEPVEIPALS